ncbi:hypothetical protein ACTWQF_10695 [Streptomyces sp. 8N114]|uniref:hypothetical protein n=1 Tax=Streptomyces sp. 8N114 TaxID=3457419 RepID=UPI003FD31079
MNDESEDDGGLDRVEAVSLYMEALKARMDPEQYERLARLVHESAHLLAEGREGIFGDEDEQAELTPEMQRELATILAMMITGGADHRVVEMSDPDGSTGFAMWKPPQPIIRKSCRRSAKASTAGPPNGKPSTPNWTVSPAPANRTKRTEELSTAPAHEGVLSGRVQADGFARWSIRQGRSPTHRSLLVGCALRAHRAFPSSCRYGFGLDSTSRAGAGSASQNSALTW